MPSPPRAELKMHISLLLFVDIPSSPLVMPPAGVVSYSLSPALAICNDVVRMSGHCPIS